MKEVTVMDVNGYEISLYPLELADDPQVHFEEPGDVNNGYFSLKFDDLMNALHDLGFPVRGWEPKPSLAEAKEAAVRKYLATQHPSKAASEMAPEVLKIIKRVEEEYK